MNFRKLIIVLLALVASGLGSSAWAHGSRVYFGVNVGGPMWGPVWYPPPYYYPPQVIVVPPPAPPPVYIEQPAPAVQSAQQQYWYYCARAKGYYPYVKDCPEGWQKVLPQPEK